MSTVSATTKWTTTLTLQNLTADDLHWIADLMQNDIAGCPNQQLREDIFNTCKYIVEGGRKNELPS